MSTTTITVITQWEVSINDHRELILLAQQEKTVMERHGALSYTLNLIYSGNNANRYLTMMYFDSWSSYATCMTALSDDHLYTTTVAAMVDFAELNSRVILTGVALH